MGIPVQMYKGSNLCDLLYATGCVAFLSEVCVCVCVCVHHATIFLTMNVHD